MTISLKMLANSIPVVRNIEGERKVKGAYYLTIPIENGPALESTRYFCYSDWSEKCWVKHDPFRDEAGSYEVNLNRVKERVRVTLFKLVDDADKVRVDDMIEELFGGLQEDDRRERL